MHDPNKPIDRQYVDDVDLTDEDDGDFSHCIDPESCAMRGKDCTGACQLYLKEEANE